MNTKKSSLKSTLTVSALLFTLCALLFSCGPKNPQGLYAIEIDEQTIDTNSESSGQTLLTLAIINLVDSQWLDKITHAKLLFEKDSMTLFIGNDTGRTACRYIRENDSLVLIVQESSGEKDTLQFIDKAEKRLVSENFNFKLNKVE